MRVDERDDERDETLVEMTYAWIDIEQELSRRPHGDDISRAFRVEAVAGENDFGDPFTMFELLFDAQDAGARAAAQRLRGAVNSLDKLIREHVQIWDRRYTHSIRVVPRSVPIRGSICGRKNEPPPGQHIDLSDVPDQKPSGSGPFVKRDGYLLTPIEVPFYDALRETAAIFAVQPWIQGVETRYRPDFMVFYDGGTVVVELDGHEYHKTREQRTRDWKRQRWFEARGIKVLRWTGSEIHANAQECVRELLEIIRGTKARF